MENIFYDFGPFRVDARERLVRRAGQPVPLTPKAFDILLVLVQNAGHILAKEEMMKRVWPDTAVEESNLARNVSTLRKALGDEPEQSQYIETIPWRGYRFVGAVKEVREPSVAIDSLAVLPFANENLDADAEYLSEGITDSLIHRLSLFSGLKVMSRHSVFRYKARNLKEGVLDAETVGRDLDVRAVLTGRIRLLHDVLLLSVELVDTSDNRHLWGAQYNRQLSEIATLQEAISEQIAERLKLIGKDKQRRTEDPEAYQLYLKGQYFWNKLTPDGVLKGIEFFQQAVEKDPAYALAYTGLQKCYGYLNRPLEAREAGARALELDPTSAEAHGALGFSKFVSRDFPGAETELKLSIELNPNYALAHHWYSIYLAHMGRHDEAIYEAKRARELDPLSPLMNQTAGNVLMLARDYDGAVDALLHTLELDPHFAAANSVLGFVYSLKGMHEEALTQFEKVRALVGNHPMVDANLKAITGRVYAAWGKRPEAMKIIEEISDPPGATPYSIAAIYAALNENDLTFEWLDRAYQAGSFEIVSLRVDPSFDNIRPDPRFQALLARAGLV